MFAKELIDKRDNFKHIPTKKLISTLNDKIKYTTHYRNLKFYLQQGMILNKVHSVFTFRQETWLKKYIEFNTQKRKETENDFEKDLFKLINNSLFGKTMESVRGRVKYEIINDDYKFLKVFSKPNVISHGRINDDTVYAQLREEVVELNKPITTGFSILDLSKLLMFDFYYNVLKPRFGNNVKLLYSDTDSFYLQFTGYDDIYKALEPLSEYLDCSDNKKHPLYEQTKHNMKVVGKFSDDTLGKPIYECANIRSKMYSNKYAEMEAEYMKKHFEEKKPKNDESIIINVKEIAEAMSENSNTCKKLKGIPKHIVQTIRHDDFVKCVKNEEHNSKFCKFSTFRSNNHEINTVEINKVGLNGFDDKRYIIDQFNNKFAIWS